MSQVRRSIAFFCSDQIWYTVSLSTREREPHITRNNGDHSRTAEPSLADWPPGRSRQPLQIKDIKTMFMLFNLPSVPFNVTPGFCRFLMCAKLPIILLGHTDQTSNMPLDSTSNVTFWTVLTEAAYFMFVTQPRKSYRVGLPEWKKCKWTFHVSVFIFKTYART